MVVPFYLSKYEVARDWFAKKLLEQIKGLGEKELAEVVLEVMLEANKGLMEEWEGDEGMLEALMEIMEP